MAAEPAGCRLSLNALAADLVMLPFLAGYAVVLQRRVLTAWLAGVPASDQPGTLS